MTFRRLSWRLVRRGALAWSVAIFLMLAVGAEAYRAGFPDPASRDQFAATSGLSRGLFALYGRAAHLETVGGFVTWRYGTTLAALLGLWAAMTTSRLLRGEEELGRAELLLAGPRSPVGLLADQSQGLGAAFACVTVAAAGGALAGGLPVRVSVFLALQVLGSVLVFSAATAAVSQLVGTRRRCLGVVGTGLGASYLLRAVADGSVHGHAIIWISPLGWVEQLSAYNNHPWVAVGSLLGAAVTAAAAAVVVRSRRDTGDGAWPVRAQVRRDRGIRSLTRLHVVLERGALLGWTGGMAATGLMLGFIAADIAKVAAENPTLSKLDSVAGTSVASIRGFLGLSFELIAVVAALYAGAQVLAARRQEETRTLENLLTAGAGRQAWLGVRLAGALLSVALVTGVTGLAVWAGVQLSGQPLPVSDALRGAANTLPVSALFLGASTLTLGLRPRAVAAVAYSSVGLSYAGLLVAVIGGAPRWIIDLSPLAHLAPVPAVAVNAGATVALSAVALLLCALGAFAFERRDVVGE